MNIQWYNPKIRAASISIASYGLVFSNGAAEMLGNPEFIRIGFSKNDSTLYVQPLNENLDGAVEFRSKTYKDYVRINDKNFILFLLTQLDDTFDITNKAVKFTARWDQENELLYVKLDKSQIEE